MDLLPTVLLPVVPAQAQHLQRFGKPIPLLAVTVDIQAAMVQILEVLAVEEQGLFMVTVVMADPQDLLQELAKAERVGVVLVVAAVLGLKGQAVQVEAG